MDHKYPKQTFDYGTELELADVDTKIVLPQGNKWNPKEVDITNSNGIGNDPWKILNRYGGEVNVKPTPTIQGQVQECDKIFKVLREQGKLSINYSCFHHVHVRVPGLVQDIEYLKKAWTYFYKWQREIADLSFSVFPKPTRMQFPNEQDYKLAQEAYRFQNSFVFQLSQDKYNFTMKSKDPQQFYMSRFNRNKITGKPIYSLCRRLHVNFMQLFDQTNTIEFRHFQPTLDLDEIRSCTFYCQELVDAMLNTGKSPMEIIEENPWLKFPKPLPFNLEMFKIFKLTGRHTDVYGTKKRKIALENIKNLIKTGYITKQDVGWWSDDQPLEDMTLVHKPIVRDWMK